MKIEIYNKRQETTYTVEVVNARYPWQLRDAFSKAMELDGYDQSTIDEVFNMQRDLKEAVKEEG